MKAALLPRHGTNHSGNIVGRHDKMRLKSSIIVIAFAIASALLIVSVVANEFDHDEINKQNRSLERLNPISELAHERMFSSIRSTASRFNLNVPAQSPTPCGYTSNYSGSYHFCEYAIYKTRIGFWSRSADAPVVMVTARPFFNAEPIDWYTSLSLIIATIDPDLSEAQIQDISLRLSKPNRSLSGTITEPGKRGLYMSRIGKKGLTFMAGRLPSE